MSQQGLTMVDARRHRHAIAARFGERIAAGDAVFMGGEAKSLPVTAYGGQVKGIGGFNRWMLMQVMRDRGWDDGRFFTAAQVEKQGWALRHGAPAVALQYVSAVDRNGLATVSPEVRRVPVYNAVDVVGLPPAEPQAGLSMRALALALMEAEIEPGADAGAALADWVRVVRAEVAPGVVDADPWGVALADSMALTAIAAHVGLGRTAGLVGHSAALGELAQADPRHLAEDPGVFFRAVRVADLCSARVVSLVRMAQAQIQAQQQGETLDAQSAQAQAGGEVMTTTGAEARRVRTASPRVEALFQQRQAVLAVPFKEKGRAQDLGAVFYPPLTVWFVPPGVEVERFREWDPREHCLGQVASEREIVDQFARDMEALGLEAPSHIETDGKWHNVKITNHSKNKRPKAGAYLLDLAGGQDGSPKGFINNKYTGESMAWTFDGPLLTPEQKAHMRAKVQRRAQEAEQRAAETRDVAAAHAAEILRHGQPADRFPYVVRKGIDAEGLCQVPGSVLLQYPEFVGENGASAIRSGEQYLIVPMSDYSGRLRAVQAINHDGSIKSFMRGAQKQGTALVLGAPSLKALCEGPEAPVCVAFAEGVATGASWRRPTDMPTVVCFDAGNLETVAAIVARSLPAQTAPVLAVDNDQFHVESALGVLASRLGVNPNARGGSVVEVLSGPSSSRLVSLGDAVADGEWHQAPLGRYRVSLEREDDSTEVRGIRLELVSQGRERAEILTFRNRGVEAGRTAMQSFASARPAGAPAVMVVPQFASLESRPTDWNDLAKLQGFGQVAHQARQALAEVLRAPAEPMREQPARSAAGIGR